MTGVFGRDISPDNLTENLCRFFFRGLKPESSLSTP